MNQFEVSILLWIQENLRGVLDGFWVFITHLGDGGYLWIAIGIYHFAFIEISGEDGSLILREF